MTRVKRYGLKDEDPDRVWSEPGIFSVFYSSRRPYMVSICIDRTATAMTVAQARAMSLAFDEAADRIETHNSQRN